MKFSRLVFYLLYVLALCHFSSCKEDEVTPEEEEEKPEEIFVALEEEIVENYYTGATPSQFTSPVISFKYPIGKIFKVTGDSRQEDYRIRFSKFTYTRAGTNIPFDTLWNDARDSVYVMQPTSVSSSTPIRVDLEFKTEKRIGNEWKEVFIKEDLTRIEFILVYTIQPLKNSFNRVSSTSIDDLDSVSVFTSSIKVNFSAPIDRILWVDSVGHDVKIVSDISIERDGQSVDVEKIYGTNNRSMNLVFDEPLCAECTYQLTVKMTFYKLLFGQPVLLSAASEALFTLPFVARNQQVAAATIIKENIDYSYPIDRHYYYLQNEYKTGYLKLKFAQEGIFAHAGEVNWIKRARVTSLDGIPVSDVTLTYDEDTHYFAYDMEVTLQNEKLYRIDFLEKELGGPGESIFHTLYIRTSKYNTFVEKFQNVNLSSGWSDGFAVGQNMGFTSEPFDMVDLYGNTVTWDKGLIKGEADLAHTPYYLEKIYPLVYDGVDDQILSIDNNLQHGVPPAKAVSLYQYPYNSQGVTAGHIAANSAPATSVTGIVGRVDNYVFYYIRDHYNQLKSKASSYSDQTHPWIVKLKTELYPQMYPGDQYPYVLRYVLPGKNIVTSEVTGKWKNPF
jgi:hypothetical protein